MKIVLARTAGFCFGVSRALGLAEKAAEAGAYAVGDVIHNESVIARLNKAGLKTVSSASDVPDGASALVRAHGMPIGEQQALSRRARIIDATCPFVSRIHKIVKKQSAEGARVVIFGMPDHPEVEAIASRAPGAVIIDSPEALEQKLKNGEIDLQKRLCFVAQTTSDKKIWAKCVRIAKKVCTSAKIFDTICCATDERQSEVTELARQSDAMVVIGSARSANTARLREICERSCKKVIFVQSANELDTGSLNGCSAVGITAGASTPAWIIKEVCDKMTDEIKTAEITENTEVEAPVTGEAEQSFAEMVENSIKTLHTGEKVKGVVTRITNTDVHVDLGTKHAGFVPLSELSDDPSVKPESVCKVGDEIEVFVTKVNDQEGIVMLSKKRVDAARGWENIDAARAERAILEGTVVEDNKGGVVASVNGVRVFIPASQTGLPKDAPMSELVRRKVKLRIIEVNRARRKVVGSIRMAEEDIRRARREQVWETIAVGQELDGVVKSITSYGAFIDVGGCDGMAHVTELSWSHVAKPADILSVGDEVRVRVIGLDPERKRISLSLKNPEDDPWKKFNENFKEGDIIDAKVVKLMPFGAFCEIIPGVDGLVYLSQLSEKRINRPSDVVSEGDAVKVKITSVDQEKHKANLSIRQAAAELGMYGAVAPSEPEEEFSPEPEEETPAEPIEETSPEPIEETSPEPVEEAPAEPVEEAPAEPAEPVEETPADQTEAQ